MLTIPTEEGFTYRIPSDLAEVIQPGMQVSVPFSRRFVSGIVIALTDKPPAKLKSTEIKEIRDLLDPEPLISRELMDLLKWISDYYVCYLGEAFRLIQSQINVGKSSLQLTRLVESIPPKLPKEQLEMLSTIPFNRTIAFKTFQKKFKKKIIYTLINQWEKKGWIRKEFSLLKKKQIFLSREFYGREREDAELSEGQREYIARIEKRQSKSWLAYQYLKKGEWTLKSTLNAAGFTTRILENLVQRRLVAKRAEKIERKISSGYHEKIENNVLSAEQQEIIENILPALAKSEFRTFLLHGITGSGKTQIYIEIIKKVLEKNRTAIVLIPEIILTPQTLARFEFYFKDKVGVIHSRLSAGEKREILYKIKNGEYPLVLGARSAIFAPLTRLGLVIVDEEHESSYKQTDTAPRYHARDVAIFRARMNQAVVVLGSATPSFESLYNMQQGHYSYFRLGKRIDERKLPRIATIDLKEEWKKGGEFPVISENLELKIESRLLTREQIMILQNRRGYSPYILCKDCGFVAKCPQCDITLTYHQKNRQLICHYCSHHERVPDQCPSCQGMDILFKGIGTQKLEETLNQKFSGTKVIRMDQDTTRGKFAHIQLLEKFRRGDADILLGTKMIAKGLDFQKLTLVGIISADQGLHFPDFRASEKVFQLLTQAAGRAGRGSSNGEVVVQTMDPTHIIFKFLNTHDYVAFFEKELENRKNLKYPPFSRLILLRLEGKEPEQLEAYGQAIVQFLWRANQKKLFSVLGPAPSPIAKIQNIYRYQILIKQEKQKDASLSFVRHILKETFLKKKNIKKWPVKLVIDVDPIEIL